MLYVIMLRPMVYALYAVTGRRVYLMMFLSMGICIVYAFIKIIRCRRMSNGVSYYFCSCAIDAFIYGARHDGVNHIAKRSRSGVEDLSYSMILSVVC